MKQEIMEAARALAEGLTLPYSLIFAYGGVTLGRTPERVDADELLEGRFFSAEREIHVYRDGGTLRAVSVSDTPEDADAVTERYELDNARPGDWIAVKRYLDYDEDGQAYIAVRRLAGWKGGASHA